MKSRLLFFLVLFCLACLPALAQSQGIEQKSEQAEAARLKVWTLRLTPGQDLRAQLELFTKRQKLRAGFIITTVGSLQKATLRLANKSTTSMWEDKFEIVSLVGTLSLDGPHLHIAISDGMGKTIGGHLLNGCEIYTTAEIVIGEAVGTTFTREKDSQTGYPELKFRRAPRATHTTKP